MVNFGSLKGVSALIVLLFTFSTAFVTEGFCCSNENVREDLDAEKVTEHILLDEGKQSNNEVNFNMDISLEKKTSEMDETKVINSVKETGNDCEKRLV